MQKVISVNLHIWKIDENWIWEHELTLVNKYLEEGYVVADRFSTVSWSTSAYAINITFVLQKNDE